jgi:hypothetical protein
MSIGKTLVTLSALKTARQIGGGLRFRKKRRWRIGGKYNYIGNTGTASAYGRRNLKRRKRY